MSNTHKKIIGIIAGLILIALGVFAFISLTSDSGNGQKPNNIATYESEDFSYPSSWKPGTIYQKEKDEGVIVKLSRTNPSINVMIRKQASDNSKIDLTKSTEDVVASLEKSVADLKVTSKGIVKLGENDLINVKYTVGTKNTIPVYYDMYILPMSGETIYLTYESESDNFNKIKSDIQSINKSYIEHIK